jgi:uncharacterized integral membrane protein
LRRKAVVRTAEPTNHRPAQVRNRAIVLTPLPVPEAGAPPAARPALAAQGSRRLPRGRAGGLWVVVVAFASVLLLLMVFILQNGDRSDVYYLGAHGHLPMGVALLLAAIFGVLLVAVPTVVRIAQLRLVAARRAGAMSTPVRKSAGSR